MARHTAFEILYRDYYPRVFGLCRRLLNSSELAEDATQEAFMRAYRKFDKFDAQQPFWQWIAAIANNHCIDLLRKRSRSRALFGDEAEMLTPGGERVDGGDNKNDALAQAPSADLPVLTEIIAAEDASSLNGAIAQLPDRFRVPLVLAYFEQSSYNEIAEQLSISRNHVGVLLLRGRERLRGLLVAGVTQ